MLIHRFHHSPSFPNCLFHNRHSFTVSLFDSVHVRAFIHTPYHHTSISLICTVSTYTYTYRAYTTHITDIYIQERSYILCINVHTTNSYIVTVVTRWYLDIDSCIHRLVSLHHTHVSYIYTIESIHSYEAYIPYCVKHHRYTSHIQLCESVCVQTVTW